MALHKDISGSDLHSPKAHASSHQNAGGDEISITGLSGLLADKQYARFDHDDSEPSALVGDIMQLIYQLPFIINRMENVLSLLAREAKRANTNFDLGDSL